MMLFKRPLHPLRHLKLPTAKLVGKAGTRQRASWREEVVQRRQRRGWRGRGGHKDSGSAASIIARRQAIEKPPTTMGLVLLYNACMDKAAEQDPRVYFAAERTFLAWIRTGLGLMGVGFAVSRFSLFLRQLTPSEFHSPAHTTGVSVWSGVALVGLGVIVILSSILRHVQLVRQLSLGTW